jgi:hypothetical protein
MVNKSKKSKSDKEYLLAKEKAKKQKIKVTYMKNGKRCYKTTEMLENEMKKKETGAGSSCEKCCLCKTRDALYKIKKSDVGDIYYQREFIHDFVRIIDIPNEHENKYCICKFCFSQIKRIMEDDIESITKSIKPPLSEKEKRRKGPFNRKRTALEEFKKKLEIMKKEHALEKFRESVTVTNTVKQKTSKFQTSKFQTLK